MEIKTKSDKDLFHTYAEIINEMKYRNLIRTNNNPVSGYAEKIVAQELGLKLERPSHIGYDGKDNNGIRYQIKSRKITPKNKSRQLGVIRNYKEHDFDFVVAVIFNEFFEVIEMWKIPWDVIEDHSKYSTHQHGRILHCKGALLDEPSVIRIK